MEIPFGNGVESFVIIGGYKQLLAGNRILPPLVTICLTPFPKGISLRFQKFHYFCKKFQSHAHRHHRRFPRNV